MKGGHSIHALPSSAIRSWSCWTPRGPSASARSKYNYLRAIDIREGETVDAGALKALVKAAVARNGPPAKKR